MKGLLCFCWKERSATLILRHTCRESCKTYYLALPKEAKAESRLLGWLWSRELAMQLGAREHATLVCFLRIPEPPVTTPFLGARISAAGLRTTESPLTWSSLTAP